VLHTTSPGGGCGAVKAPTPGRDPCTAEMKLLFPYKSGCPILCTLQRTELVPCQEITHTHGAAVCARSVSGGGFGGWQEGGSRRLLGCRSSGTWRSASACSPLFTTARSTGVSLASVAERAPRGVAPSCLLIAFTSAAITAAVAVHGLGAAVERRCNISPRWGRAPGCAQLPRFAEAYQAPEANHSLPARALGRHSVCLLCTLQRAELVPRQGPLSSAALQWRCSGGEQEDTGWLLASRRCQASGPRRSSPSASWWCCKLSAARETGLQLEANPT
jgi:hypothetical protein